MILECHFSQLELGREINIYKGKFKKTFSKET